MAVARTIHKDLFRVFLLTLVSLFAIPAATLVFTEYALRSQDAEFLQAIESRIAADTRLSAADKALTTEFYRSHPLSKACSATAPATQSGIATPARNSVSDASAKKDATSIQ